MAIQNESYIGKGNVLIQNLSGGGLIHIGNCSKFSFAITEDKKTLGDFMNAGGGDLDTLTRIKSLDFEIEATSFHNANIALATNGSVNALAGGPVTGEVHEVEPGSYVVPKKLFDSAGAVVVKSTDGLTTYVNGTDYMVNTFGIEILVGGTIVAGDVKVDYVSLAGNAVEALVNSQKEYRVVFAGLNEARSGKQVVIEIHRGVLSPTKNLDVIADDFGRLMLSGSALRADFVTGLGLSQFMNRKYVV